MYQNLKDSSLSHCLLVLVASKLILLKTIIYLKISKFTSKLTIYYVSRKKLINYAYLRKWCELWTVALGMTHWYLIKYKCWSMLKCLNINMTQPFAKTWTFTNQMNKTGSHNPKGRQATNQVTEPNWSGCCKKF